MNSNSICREPTRTGNCGLNHGHYGPHSCCTIHDRPYGADRSPMPDNYWDMVEASKR